MKAFLTIFLISVLSAVGYSECIYFRVSVKLVKCEKVDPKAEHTKDPYPETASDNLDLEEPGTRSLIQISCECQYSLSGSNVLCDPDQTLERTSVTGAEKPEEACRRGRSLCKDVCPSRLP